MINFSTLIQNTVTPRENRFTPTQELSYSTLLKVEQLLSGEQKQTAQLKKLQNVLKLAPAADMKYLKELEDSSTESVIILSVDHFKKLEQALSKINHSPSQSQAERDALQIFMANKNKKSFN